MAKITLAESKVVFDEAKHTYTLDGKKLSGITGVIQNQLFKDEFENVPEDVLQKAAAYGTSVHKSIELFDSEWTNDGSPEVELYIDLIQRNNLNIERSEYLVSDNKNWASSIDKVYRTGDDTFIIADIKTYSMMSPEKLEKARWQLSIYKYLFELQNPKAKVEKLSVFHLRDKTKSDGTRETKQAIYPLTPIPKEIVMELLNCELKGLQFQNPFAMPDSIRQQESVIKDLMEKKKRIEAELEEYKTNILEMMKLDDIKFLIGDYLKITRKADSVRQSFDFKQFQKDHPNTDFSSYMKVSSVSGGLVISY